MENSFGEYKPHLFPRLEALGRVASAAVDFVVNRHSIPPNTGAANTIDEELYDLSDREGEALPEGWITEDLWGDGDCVTPELPDDVCLSCCKAGSACQCEKE